MKKKILFVLISMNVGGTEKALLNMISEIPKDEFELTILMLEEYGGLLGSIPSEVTIENLQGYKNMKDILNKPAYVNALNYFKKGKIVKAVTMLYLYIISKVTNNRRVIFRYVLKDHPINNKAYDIAVAYAGPMEFITYFVLNHVIAKKKVQWIHFDVTKIGFSKSFACSTFNKFDKIFVVSHEGKKKLIDWLPGLQDRIETFSNLISPEQVVKMAKEGVGFEDDFDGVRILTVGRLSKEKGQDITIPVLAKLKGKGYKIRWYCIGDGSARAEFENLIKKYDVENDYILLGSKTNPYPFMKQCDVYMQPSRHEGYCITLSEARCFDNPIISTNFTGAKEQIVHNQTGIVVDFDVHEIYNALKRILDDDMLRNNLKENLQNEIFYNSKKDIEKLYQILDNV